MRITQGERDDSPRMLRTSQRCELEVEEIVPVAESFLSFCNAVSLSSLTRTVRVKSIDIFVVRKKLG